MPIFLRSLGLGWAVRAQTEDGKITLGQAVPLTELLTQTQWSRVTCARRLRSLAGEGLLTRYDGLGYFVTARPGQRHEGQT